MLTLVFEGFALKLSPLVQNLEDTCECTLGNDRSPVTIATGDSLIRVRILSTSEHIRESDRLSATSVENRLHIQRGSGSIW